MAETDALAQLQDFFSRPVAHKGMGPIKKGVEIAVFIGEQGPFTLTKEGKAPQVRVGAPAKPDMTFRISELGLLTLLETHTEDVGEIGVAILKQMAHSDANQKLKAKVHIGLFDLIRKGYLGVLPLGGATVMKFLGSKGLTGMGKIKDSISKLREP